jgi:serine/threonine protein phosphatase PrpC
LKTPNKHN